MSAPRSRLPGGSAVLLVDALVLAWIVLWIVVAVAIADAVKELTILSDTVADAGRAVQGSGEALGSLRDLPLIGDRLGAAAGAIVGAGLDVVREGRVAEARIVSTANMLGLVVGALGMPGARVLPPARASPGRPSSRRCADHRAGGGRSRPRAAAGPARGASPPLPPARPVSPQPWRDLEEGRHRPLAEAELKRVGLGRRALAASDEGARAA